MCSRCFGCFLSCLFICLGVRESFRWSSIFDAVYFHLLYLGRDWGVCSWSFLSQKAWAQDWERIAQKSDMKPGMRLARMSNQDYGQLGQGFFALILAGPDWISRISDEKKALIRPSNEVAGKLENLRQHFAARDSWVPLNDFLNHETEIYLLAKLEILSIREFAGEWYFHVTVQGTVRRIESS